jgi:YegS/Rv2252/BmrU family lipid kinase
MKTLLIVNPESGKGRGGKLLNHIKQYITENANDCTIKLTTCRGHATEIIKKESPGYQKIIVTGGDGTLNEVINGLDLTTEKQIGLLPIGSGNDFAKALSLPKSIDNNLTLVFNDTPRQISPDIGQVSILNDNEEVIKSSRFTNSCGIGFDAYVAHLNQTNKVLSGLSSYIVAILKALWEHNSVNIEARFDDREYSGEKLFVCIGNGETAGGGLYLTPGAVIDDGYLNYTIVERVSRLKLLRYLPLAVINKLTGIKYVQMSKFKDAYIKLRQPFYVHNDGEIVSDSASIIKVESLTSELKFIVP